MSETEKDLQQEHDFEAGLAKYMKESEQVSDPDPTPEPEPEPNAPADEPEAEPEPFPGFGNLPKEARDAFLKLQQERDEVAAAKAKVDNDFKALHHRVAPVQSEADRLRSALRDRDEALRKIESQRQGTPSDSKWAKFISSLPEEDREAFLELRTAQQAEIAELKDALKATGSTVGEIRSKIVEQQEIASLDTTHAGWFETVQTAEFGGWLSRQPAQVQSLADSKSSDDYRYLLDTFHATTQPQTPQKSKGEQIAEARKAVVSKSAPVSRGSASSFRTAGLVDGDDPGWIAYLREQGELK